MFRTVVSSLYRNSVQLVRTNVTRTSLGGVRYMSESKIDYEKYDAEILASLVKPDIDGWELRNIMNELQGMDMVPEPKLIIASMQACRRLNDISLAVRYLEAIQEKCGNRVKEIWPYLLQEIQPTLKELGIPTPEELGYDKPELASVSVYDLH